MNDQNDKPFAISVTTDDIGKRLDAFIAATFPQLSRNTASRLIRNGDITISGSIKKPGYRITVGDIVSGHILELAPYAFEPEPIDIQILFEDSLFLVINKQPGIVVHPSPGHSHGTIANGLLFLRPQIEGVGVDPNRPGIVHRLDKDTSGIMVVAKTERAYDFLVSQFKNRLISKTYLGIVYGIPDRNSGQIVLNIGRHATQRKKMSVTDGKKGRIAETHWRIQEKYQKLCLVEFNIKTGRTHQIRVHSAAIKHPIVGDQTYGLKRPHKLFDDMPPLKKLISGVPRQMLHAWQLGFLHPETGENLRLEAPLPGDMANLIHKIKSVI